MIWYLSFAKTEDEGGFQGGFITECETFEQAYTLSLLFRVNLHGEVLGFPVPENQIIDKKYFNRALNMQEIKTIWQDAATLSELENASNIT
jgi:hypothetical protein